MMRIAAILALFAVLLSPLIPAPAKAWGEFGHRTTGDVAMANLSPQARGKIMQLMRAEAMLGTPECSLQSLQDAAVWPDCVRRSRWRWGYTAAWHYRTAPICQAYEPWRNCSGGNCVTAQIERGQRLLADESLPSHIRLQALAFMTHFIGDVHMPLHSGDKDDRGGNDREAAYGIAQGLNLHWIWDGPLAERAISSARPTLVRRYSAAERADLGGGDVAEWGRESWQIARDFIYPTAFDTQDVCGQELPSKTQITEEDIQQSIPISQRRISQAGIRMAEAIDAAFEPGPLHVEERPRR